MKKLSITCCVFSALAGIIHVIPLFLLFDMFDYIHIYGVSYNNLLNRFFQEGWSRFSALLLLYFLLLAISIICVLACNSQRIHRLRLFFIFYLGSSVVSFLAIEVLLGEFTPLGIFLSLGRLLILLVVVIVHKNTDETFF